MSIRSDLEARRRGRSDRDLARCRSSRSSRKARASRPTSTAACPGGHIGPEGNRISAVAGVAGDPLVYYAGAASGGICKTTDGGVHWEPIFDDQPVQSIGALAVAPSDPNTVWAGTGEGVHPQPHLGRRGHLQVHRRRQDVDAHGPRADRPHRHGRRASEEPGRRAGLRAGPRLRAAAGARRVPHDGRRQDLGARAVRRREHRLLRPRDGSDEPAHALRRHVAARDPHLGPRERRARQRPLHVAATAARPGRGSRAAACRRATVGKVDGRDRAVESRIASTR